MTSIRLVRDDLRPPGPPPRKHLLSVSDLTSDDVQRLLGTARTFESALDREVKKLPTLKGRLVVNLFYESSTRTSSSFELAAKRLSADTLMVKSAGSSVDKGESLKDTAQTLGAYDPDVIVIRHPQIGAPQLVARVTAAHVVNAGDGKHQHPTQALLDLYTMQQELGRLEGLHVAVVGDVLHSRVARSNIHLLGKFGCHFSLCGPAMWVPRELENIAPGTAIRRVYKIEEAVEGADVIIMLRVQTERQHEASISANDYIHGYQLNAERLKRAKPDALVLHPGPMNRGIEITPEVADGPQSCVLEQVTNGVAVRMAILYLLTAGEVEGGAAHPATQAVPGTPAAHNRRATDRSAEQPVSKGKDS